MKDEDNQQPSHIKMEGSTTILQGSTLQANGNGNGEYPKMDKDIV